jgi:hypothetical protein
MVIFQCTHQCTHRLTTVRNHLYAPQLVQQVFAPGRTCSDRTANLEILVRHRLRVRLTTFVLAVGPIV